MGSMWEDSASTLLRGGVALKRDSFSVVELLLMPNGRFSGFDCGPQVFKAGRGLANEKGSVGWLLSASSDVLVAEGICFSLLVRALVSLRSKVLVFVVVLMSLL